MKIEELCRALGQWFMRHKDENPFAFGEIHLSTEDPEADISLIIGKPEEAFIDLESHDKQWEGTLYDAPVTWIWERLAHEEADDWLRHIYEREAGQMKENMLVALLELARLIEGNGYSFDWQAEADESERTRLYIDQVEEKVSVETDRWSRLLASHRAGS
ncbi:hypothetical protein SIID45300_00731 [Candidatus Magnetaquicoccaceae bacterium FCR-1]|uniref:Uncharacterized protein n=1 Tax=Candidatus Magnetaquiglobus chichijimensis TaxID=3141448 RepID=A0ABQ0C6A8_9PROT